MTTELVILLTTSVFILSGAFVGPNSAPRRAFRDAAPNLGARIEHQIDTGAGFQELTKASYKPMSWTAGDGDFQ
jgi:hypothetical protein